MVFNFKLTSYLNLVLLHILLGVLSFFVPKISLIYSMLLFVLGLVSVVNSKDKFFQILKICALIIGSEVFLRMTDGVILYETAKYQLAFFSIIGILYTSFTKGALIYILYLLMMIPGIIYGIDQLDLDTNIRKAIIFNLGGPVSLGLFTIFCFGKQLNIRCFFRVLSYAILPIVSTLVYIVLYNPFVGDVIKGTHSNFVTSGGFGPNQVSTVLGLGMLFSFMLLLLNSKSKKLLIINTLLLIGFTYRAVLTFSRGGVITAIVCMVLVLALLYGNLTGKAKLKLVMTSLISMMLLVSIWGVIMMESKGLIQKRYANQDAIGQAKQDALGGREEIIRTELQLFVDHPIIGIGVGRNKAYKREIMGVEVAAHNEFSRLLAEHGIFGVFMIVILVVTPLVFFNNRRIQFLLLLPLFLFWGLTISHAATRLALPSFVYGLILIHLKNDE